MKMKIGSRLYAIRQEKKFNQAEMADLLGVSPATYSRIERNESSIDLEQLSRFAEILQVPLQEFLPETFAIHNKKNESGQVGFIIGNYYNALYMDNDAEKNQLRQQIALQEQKILFLDEKIKILESELETYKKILLNKS